MNKGARRAAQEEFAREKARRAVSSQRPSVPMDAPALTRHLLFRIPGSRNPRWRPHNTNRQDIWAALLFRMNRTISACRAAFGGTEDRLFWIKLIHGETPAANQEYASESSTFLLTPEAGAAYRVRLRVAVYLETLAFTFIVDQMEAGCEPRRKIDAALAATAGDGQIAAIGDIFDRGCGMPFPDISRLMSEEISYDADAMRSAIGTIGRDKARLFRDSTIGFGGQVPMFERAVAEFHGLVLPAAAAAKFSSVDSLHQAPAPEQGLTKMTQRFTDTHAGFIRNFIGARWHHGGDGGDTDEFAAEAVVCGMLSGRALYASPISMKFDQRSQVNYLVAYDGTSEAQLGRFIHRLHVMGELRLSALMDFDGKRRNDELEMEIRDKYAVPLGEDTPPELLKKYQRVRNLVQAGQEIRRIGEELNQLEAKMKSLGAVRGGTAGADDFVRQFDGLLDISLDYSAINACASGGLVFRVERSRYYADAYDRRMPDLRIRRIEGWQPYDEFARRYVFQLFEQIAGFGIRYGALGRRIDRFHSWRHTAEIMLQAATSVEQTGEVKRATEASVRQGDDTRKLLERAEDIGIVAALYYGYGLLKSQPAPYEWMHMIGGGIAIAFLFLYLADTLLLRRSIRHRVIDGFHAIARRIAPRRAPSVEGPKAVAAPPPLDEDD
ncbi:hypothetical protein BWQ93_01400 [Sphingopyxis sp. QXT-31]|uniref:hypothetical protein n=1 Tax=Sphingopyxis sp. QXT-31 TaxID=1357916 RepID=UPI000979693E|nr:hypothetical protein [Sphingopyxis sp. QXT-31]APZ97295.1 hypothetical protein BWQ93_01400 [Sphingopyxis sp. QXT-31]